MSEIEAEEIAFLDGIRAGAADRAEVAFLDHAAGAAWTSVEAKAAAFDALLGMNGEIAAGFNDAGLHEDDPLIHDALRAEAAFLRRFVEVLSGAQAGGTC